MVVVAFRLCSVLDRLDRLYVLLDCQGVLTSHSCLFWFVASGPAGGCLILEVLEKEVVALRILIRGTGRFGGWIERGW